MASKSETLISLAGVDFSSVSKDELKSIFKETLEAGLHGICFSPYTEGQEPGNLITEKHWDLFTVDRTPKKVMQELYYELK